MPMPYEFRHTDHEVALPAVWSLYTKLSPLPYNMPGTKSSVTGLFGCSLTVLSRVENRLPKNIVNPVPVRDESFVLSNRS